jgi:hypothetical protein
VPKTAGGSARLRIEYDGAKRTRVDVDETRGVIRVVAVELSYSLPNSDLRAGTAPVEIELGAVRDDSLRPKMRDVQARGLFTEAAAFVERFGLLEQATTVGAEETLDAIGGRASNARDLMSMVEALQQVATGDARGYRTLRVAKRLRVPDDASPREVIAIANRFVDTTLREWTGGFAYALESGARPGEFVRVFHAPTLLAYIGAQLGELIVSDLRVRSCIGTRCHAYFAVPWTNHKKLWHSDQCRDRHKTRAEAEDKRLSDLMDENPFKPRGERGRKRGTE